MYVNLTMLNNCMFCMLTVWPKQQFWHLSYLQLSTPTVVVKHFSCFKHTCQTFLHLCPFPDSLCLAITNFFHISSFINLQNNSCLLLKLMCVITKVVWLQTDKDNSVPTGTTSSSLVWRAWQQWHRNNLMKSLRSFCEKQKLSRSSIFNHQRTQKIAPHLVSVLHFTGCI